MSEWQLFSEAFHYSKTLVCRKEKKIAPCGSLAIKKLRAYPQGVWEDGLKYFPNRKSGRVQLAAKLSLFVCLCVCVWFFPQMHTTHLKIILYYTQDELFSFRNTFYSFYLIKIFFFLQGPRKRKPH